MGIDTKGLIVRANGKDVGCLQSLGDISQKRNTKEYACINGDDIVVAVGNIKTDPISMSVLYNPADANGAGELEKAFNDGTKIPFEIELSDKPDGGTNGTKFSWDKTVISEFKITSEEDGMALASFTITVNGKPTVTAAA